ncbi:MAG TPA: hypothetical protein VIM11_01840, partial [Tepidisphaeraceae bacterium]
VCRKSSNPNSVPNKSTAPIPVEGNQGPAPKQSRTQTCVLLLCGGDKRKQSSDIAKAIEYLKDYKKQSASP